MTFEATSVEFKALIAKHNSWEWALGVKYNTWDPWMGKPPKVEAYTESERVIVASGNDVAGYWKFWDEQGRQIYERIYPAPPVRARVTDKYGTVEAIIPPLDADYTHPWEPPEFREQNRRKDKIARVSKR